jgi:ribonucleotide monophosphatase NagD (HAD superfamily)
MTGLGAGAGLRRADGAIASAGGAVVLLSNAPGPSQQVAGVLDAKRVPREAWDAAGDLGRRHQVADRREPSPQGLSYRLAGATAPIFDGLDIELVGEDEADIVVATELNDYRTETPEQYRPLLERFAARGLPFICGNPDLVVHVGEDLLPCAGALATIYEELGGSVAWAGKPYRPAYDLALEAARRCRVAVIRSIPARCW